jgi:hypothetical protein
MTGPVEETRLVPPGFQPPATYEPQPWDSRGATPPPGPFEVSSHPKDPSGFVHGRQRRGRRLMHAIYVVLVIAILAGVGLRIFDESTSSKSSLEPGSGVTSLPDAIPPGVGLIVRSPTGHFAVRMPHRPLIRSTYATTSTGDLTLTYAIDTTSKVIVEGADITPALTSSRVNKALDAAVAGLQNGVAATMTIRESHALRFQNRAARQVSIVDRSGRRYTALVVVYGSTRFYALFAPSGPAFDAFVSSFVALP